MSANRNPVPATSHLYGIDLLRFVAAMLVLLHHFSRYAADSPEVVFDTSHRAYGFLSPFEFIGATGVEIFFVISGFVIAMSAGSLSGLSGAVRFAKARAMRILPALWISAAISLVVSMLIGQSLSSLISPFIRTIILSPAGPYIDGVVWSLVVEAVFYAVIATAIMVARPLPLAKIALCIGALSSLYLTILLAITIHGDDALVATLTRFPSKVFLLRYGVFFAVGIFLWMGVGPGRERSHSFAMIAFGLFGCIELLLENWANTDKAIGSIAVWLGGMALLVSAIHWKGIFPPSSTVRLLGNMSYTIYLNHFTTGMAIVYLVGKTGITGFPSFALALSGVLLVSYMVVRAEQAVRALIRGRRVVRPQPVAP